MDIGYALEQIERHIWLRERVPLPPDEMRANRKTRIRGTSTELHDSDNAIRAIAEAIYGQSPRWISSDFVYTLKWELTEGDEVRSKLGLDAPAPTFNANSLHPWVWDAARPHWLSGNHDAAVWAAAVNVNSRLQQKVGRFNLGETRLLNEVFSLHAPEANRPRLRLVDDVNPDLFKDVHLGAAALGHGLYSAVRNPLNHVDADIHQIGEAEALEALAGFSLLSRWIDRARVVASS
ncbi:TIGR02391 family protein [Leifsonia sp. Leaf336]|uniref:TIGR02391 family protein n=1 Tax=Leifsonia sp. Leaf336 TaxID=1736341 RepID=UPI0009EAD995|nr:TIGR02391 family protein [Leifsonia sp. Leaf336]